MNITPMRVVDEPFYRSAITGRETLSASVMREGDIVLATGHADADGDVEVVTDNGHIEMVCPDVLERCYEPGATVRLLILEAEIESIGDLEGAMETYSRRLRVRRELIAGRGKHCSSCGELKHAYHFVARPDGSRYGECRSCTAAAKRAQRLAARQAADACNTSRADS